MAPTTPDLRTLLKLPKSATHHEIKQAFNKAALATHPDKLGGNNEAVATLNAAKAVYDKGRSANSDDDDEHDDGDDDDDNGDDTDDEYTDIDDNQSDEDYHPRDGALSDGEAVSASGDEGSVGENDGEEVVEVAVGDNEKIPSCFLRVVMEELGLEVTIKEHEEICGCDLTRPDAIHYLKTVTGNDDTDSGDEELEDVDEGYGGGHEED